MGIEKKFKSHKSKNYVETASYAFASYGQNVIFGIVSSALLYYYQSVIFLPAITIAVLNAAMQAVNIFKDPAMGSIIDRTKSRFGKCRPYLMISPLLITAATIGCFINGIWSENNSSSVNAAIIGVAVATNVIWNFLFTAGDVPLTTLPSVMTSETDRKSRLISYSMIAATLGIGTVSLFFIPFAQYLGKAISPQIDNSAIRNGFVLAAIIFTAAAGIMYSLAGIFTKERVGCEIKTKNYSIKASLKAMKDCKPFRRIIIAGLLRAPADTMTSTLTMIIVYYFGNNGNKSYIFYMMLFLLTTGIGQIAAMVIAPKLASKFEKKKLMITGLIASALSTLCIFVMYIFFPNALTHPALVAVFTVMLFIAGAFFGVVNVTQSAMIADTVDFAEFETGKRLDGSFFSGLTSVNKISVGVTSLITGIVYAVAGFSGDGVKNVNDALTNGANFSDDPAFAKFRFAMFFLMSIPPAIGLIMSVIPLIKYPLSNKKHSEIIGILENRRNNKAIAEQDAIGAELEGTEK